MKLLKLDFRGAFLFFFFVFQITASANPRQFNYYFSNGALLRFEGGVLSFTPASDEIEALPFEEKIPTQNMVLVPENPSQTSKNPDSTTLSNTQGGPLLLITPSAEAVPLIWHDGQGSKKVAFITQNGKFLELDEAIMINSKVFSSNTSTFSYRIVRTSETAFTILATAGNSPDNAATSMGRPWILNSEGLNRVVNFDVPTNFVFTFDDNTLKTYFEKNPSKNKLLELSLSQPGQFSHENKNDFPNWANDKKYRPKFCLLLNKSIEWLSDTQGRIAFINDPSPLVNPATNSKPTPQASKNPKALTAIPEIQIESGKKAAADKIVYDFASPYKLEELDDFGFNTEEFRPLAVSLFSDPSKSIVVTGESGGGKTTYVEAFVRSVLAGEFKNKGIDPSNIEIIRFSAASLTSGTTLRGAEEARVDALIKYSEWAQSNGKQVIYFIDEIHTLTMSGSSSADGNDVFQSLLTPLAKGSIKVIGTSTDEGYLQIASRPDLERRLSAYAYKGIKVSEIPSQLEKWLKAKNKAPLSLNTLEYITQVAIEFDSSGEPISRATKLLSYLFSEANFDGLSVDTIEGNLDYILDVAARFYGYNVHNFTLETLDDKLKEIDEKFSHIVGFDQIKESIKTFHIRCVTRSRLPHKAEGRYLFISPKGLGKSTTVQSIASALGRPYVRIPVSTFTDKEMLYAEVARAAKKNPYSVIFFDELGDAPKEIIIALNSALDAQTISADLNYGKTSTKHTKTTIDLGRTIIFAATNSGASLIEETFKKSQRRIGFGPSQTEPESKVSIDIEALKERSIDEGLVKSLIDRFEVIPILYYSKEEFTEILRIHFNDHLLALNKRNQLGVVLDENVQNGFIEYLLKKYFSETASPRSAIKELESTIEDYFAYLAVKDKSPQAAAISAKACKALLGE